MIITASTLFYGPFPCDRCRESIVRSSVESGSMEFDEPEGPIYPNTQWHTHRCAGYRPPEPRVINYDRPDADGAL